MLTYLMQMCKSLDIHTQTLRDLNRAIVNVIRYTSENAGEKANGSGWLDIFKD